jgi:hypothetical protein
MYKIRIMILSILFHPPHPNPLPPFRVERETIFASPVKGED